MSEQQQMHDEQQVMALNALFTCRASGAPDKELELLAAMLGVSKEWQRMHGLTTTKPKNDGRTKWD